MNRKINILVTLVGFGLTGSNAIAQTSAPLDCLLEPHLEVNVGSPVVGILASVNVDRGDIVSENQIVAELVSNSEAAGVELAEARALFNERKVERNDDLYKDELISIHEKDEIETESLISKLELEESRQKLEMRTIRSPLSGVVVDRYLSRGEFVQERPIMKLAQINPLNVEVIAPVALFGSIRVGSIARLHLEPPLGGDYEVTVSVVDRVVDAASGTFGVRFELPNPDNAIPSGLRCKIYLDGTN
jgi:RND family efflux transporter MFP subunit